MEEQFRLDDCRKVMLHYNGNLKYVLLMEYLILIHTPIVIYKEQLFNMIFILILRQPSLVWFLVIIAERNQTTGHGNINIRLL